MKAVNAFLSRLMGLRVVRQKEFARLVQERDRLLGERDAFLRDRYKSAVNTIGQFYRSPRAAIEVVAGRSELDAMFTAINDVWNGYGSTEPYWSVLTAPVFERKAITQEMHESFYATGLSAANLVDEFFQRSDLAPPGGVCLEFGCGVGRVTHALARKFEKVIGVDFSDGHLDLARTFAGKEGVKNVEFMKLRSLSDVSGLERYDFLFSTIVFQHNPPPLQAFLLDALFEKIRVGGGCLFQLPTEHPDTPFDLKSYLSVKPRAMEMFSLPMPNVLGLIKKHNLQIREVRPDNFTGSLGSFTFFAFPKSD